MKKNKIKASLIATTCLLPILSTPFLTFFYSNNQKQVFTNYMENLNTKSYDILPKEDVLNNENALYLDAYNKATYDPDSVLVYSIYWFGVFHRFGVISHILSVLDVNPDQKIYVMETSGRNDYSSLLEIDETTGKRIYPNVHIYEENDNWNNTDNTWWLTNRFVTPTEFFDKVKLENPNSRIHGYFADFVLHAVIDNYFNGANLPILKKNIFNYWSFFNDFESFNIFSDGNASVELFYSNIYDYMLKADIGEYDGSEYTNAKLLRKGLKDKTRDKRDFLENNNAILFIISLMITKDYNGDNIYPDPNNASDKEIRYTDSAFFLPTTQFINDMNQNSIDNPNSYLKTNDEDKFNPFNSVEADLLQLFRLLKPDKINNLGKIIGLEKNDYNAFKQEINSQMKDKINYVYSGSLLYNSKATDPNQNERSQKEHVEVLRAIYEINKKENPGKTIQVVYKGHPRDETKEKIEDILYTNFKKYFPEEADELNKHLLVLDPKIPYEFYLFLEIFDSDPTENKEVKLYSAFSTIIWFLFADGRADDLINIIVPNSLTSYITGIYGYKSPIFNSKDSFYPDKPNNKLITIEELKEQVEA